MKAKWRMISHIVFCKEMKHARREAITGTIKSPKWDYAFAGEYPSCCPGQITVEEGVLSPCAKQMPLQLLLASQRKSNHCVLFECLHKYNLWLWYRSVLHGLRRSIVPCSLVLNWIALILWQKMVTVFNDFLPGGIKSRFCVTGNFLSYLGAFHSLIQPWRSESCSRQRWL